MSGLKLPAALQTPQKKEKQVTAKKTPEKEEEDDEYAGSTDVDEPGWHQALFNVTELWDISASISISAWLSFRLLQG